MLKNAYFFLDESR